MPSNPAFMYYLTDRRIKTTSYIVFFKSKSYIFTKAPKKIM